MSNLWAGPRQPSWKLTLLNSRDEAQADLLGVSGGKVEIVTLSRLGGTASLNITETDQNIDWMNHRVKIEYDPGVVGLEPVPWGIWLFSSPAMSNESVKRYQVTLLSKMVIIDEDSVTESFSIAENTPIIPLVESIIRSTGERSIATTPSDATTTNALTFKPSESKLTIINELLQSAGYRALWVDRNGQFRINPQVDPGGRGVSYTFEAGEASIHKPGWTREQDLAGVPNRVVVFVEGDDENPGITGLAENWDLDSPFSIPNRNGRIISRQVEPSDISSQEEADAQALRYLIGGMSPVAHLKVEHAIVPLDPGDRVRFIAGTPPEQRDATVQRMTVNIDPFSQVTAEWRELN